MTPTIYTPDFGYIITTSRDQGTYGPIGAIDADGSYEKAFADAEVGVNLAIYPTKEDAEAEVARVCKGTDPLVFDGMRVVSLRQTKNHTAHQLVAYGMVTYPKGKPARTDYDSRDFLGV